MSDNPKIYVADLEAYNNGKLKGEWLDLTDYSDGSEVLEAIEEIVGENEYAIHDYENFPSDMYSEYMGESEFDDVFELIEVSESSGLPIDVISEWVNDTGGDVSDIEDAYYGEYSDKEDFAYQLVDEGVLVPDSNSVYVSETDRRIIAGEEAGYRVDDIYDEKEFIQDYGDIDAYEEAEEEEDENRMEEILDEAKEKLRDEIYDDWYDGLEDPIEFLVNEQGLYTEEDALKQSFIQVDYEKVADELGYDFTFIDGDGLYVFSNNYAKGGKVRSKRSINTDRARISQEPWEQAYKSKRKGNYYAKGGMLEIDTIYDNGGTSADRYTLIDEDGDMYGIGGRSVNMYIGHRTEYPSDLSHLGKKVKYEDLSDEVKKEIDKRLDTSNFAKGGEVYDNVADTKDAYGLSNEEWDEMSKEEQNDYRKASLDTIKLGQKIEQEMKAERDSKIDIYPFNHFYAKGGEIKKGDKVKYNGYEYFVEGMLDDKTYILSNPKKFGHSKEYRTIEEIEYAKGGKTWVQDVTNSPNFKEGSFSAKAEKRGMSSKAFMKQVLHSPSEYDETTRKQAQFMKNAFKFELGGEVEKRDEAIEFTIPQHYASAIVNADMSGLDDEDESELNSFIDDVLEEHGNAMFMLGDKSNDTYFSPYNDINNMGSDVTTLYLIPSNQSKQYAVGGEVIYTDLSDNTQSRKIWESRKSKNTGQNSFGSFAHKYNGKYVGDSYLYRLDEFDEDYYKHIKLKDGEILARHETDNMVGSAMPLVKLNLKKGFVHFMTDSEDDKNPKFDRSSAKVIYLSLDKAIQNYAKRKGTKWN